MLSKACVNILCRERCNVCGKYVYKHQHVIVCALDGNIFHGSCLGFNRDTCFHIQSSIVPDWFCPNCALEIFPFYDSIADLSHVPCVCKFCLLNKNTESVQHNSTFNPFSVDFDSDYNFNSFDDSMCDVLSTTQYVLDNCSYSGIYELSTCSVDKSFSTFYFDNIDGYKSNFQESLINIKSMKKLPSIIAFCEANLKIDDPDNYTIFEYNSEHFYALPNKNKGSGLSMYYNKLHIFNQIPSPDTRNKHFECMGGRLKSENTQVHIIVVYRFRDNEAVLIEQFSKIISDYKDEPLLILGDFNIDLLKYDTDPHDDKFVNTMMSNSQFPLVNKPTNFFRETSTLIDHAWCNILHDNTKANALINISVSSHKPIFAVILTALKQFVGDTEIKNMQMHKINEDTINTFKDEFENIASSSDYNKLYTQDSSQVRAIFSQFYEQLTFTYSKNIVIDKNFNSKRNKYDKLWISEGLAKSFPPTWKYEPLSACFFVNFV